MSIWSSVKSYAKNVVGGAKIVSNYLTKPITGNTNNMAGVYAAVMPKTITKTTPTNYTPSLGGYSSSPTPVSTYVPGGYSSVHGYEVPATPISQAPVNIRAGGGGQVAGAYTSSNLSSTPTTMNALNIGSSSLGGIASFSSPSYSSASPSTMSSSPGGGSTFNMNSLLTPTLSGMGYTIKDNQLIPPKETTATDGSGTLLEKTLKGIKGMFPEPKPKADLYKQAQIDAGIAEKQNLVNTYTQQINSINSNLQADKLALREVGSKEGVTETVYGGQQAQLEREATIKTLRIAPLLAAASGDLQQAQDNLNTYFKVMSDDQDAQYKYQTDLITMAYGIADKAQQRELDALATQKTQAHSDKLAMMNDVHSFASSLMSSNPQAAARLLNLDPNSPTYMAEASRIIGQVQPKLTGAQNDQSAINSINSQLSKAVGEDGFTDPNLYARLRASSGISPTEFDNRFGYLVNPASYAKLGLSGTKETSMTGEQLKQKINSQIATQDFKDLSKTDKKDYILSQGGDPTDFGY